MNKENVLKLNELSNYFCDLKDIIFYSHGVDGVFTFVSDSIKDVLGYFPEEFKINYENVLTDNPINEKCKQYTELSINGLKQPPYQIEVFHKNGHSCWLEISESPVFDSKGNVFAINGIAKDVTLSKNNKEALTKIESINKVLLETTDICLKEIHKNDGPGYTLMYLSLAGQKQLGITNIEKYYGGPYPADVYPEEASKVTTEALDRLVSTGKSTQVECELFDVNGNSVWYLTTYSVQRKNEDGRIASITAASQNITQRKKDQDALAKYTKELAESNKELENFALIASHDLQEPLRKITIFGDRVLIGAANLDEKSRDYIQRMQKSTLRMSCFIEDLLHYSRITTASRPNEIVDIEDSARTVCEQLDHTIKLNNAVINIGSLPKLEGIKSQFDQLFSNLITNSLKFKRKDENPKINIFGEKDVTGHWKIVIEDNGIGLDEKYLEKIFQPFQRLHGRSEYEGTGLGLSICKKIVDHHNGTITVKSKLGEGATFIIELPEKQTPKD
jgi:PAS domain S-box-containing protein